VFIYFAADIWGITTAFIRDHFALLTGRRGMRFFRYRWCSPDMASEEAWLGWLIYSARYRSGRSDFLFKDFIEAAGHQEFMGDSDNAYRCRTWAGRRRKAGEAAKGYPTPRTN